MLHINSLLINVHHDEEELLKKISKTVGCNTSDIKGFEIKRRSIDARKKPEIFYAYSIDVDVKNEKRYIKNKNITVAKSVEYSFNKNKNIRLEEDKRPVVVGFGPAGIFAALLLSRNGCRPIVIERGECTDERVHTVERFWNEGILNVDSNVSFGEGGAGTFSDGKLNTLVKDTFGRNKYVLNTFVEFGAPKEILYDNKPHIGTDLLTNIIRNIREEIKRLGGEVRFNTRLTDIKNIKEDKKIICVKNTVTGEESSLITNDVVLALGHSARDTFKVLKKLGIYMEAKSFAIGIRVVHSQHLIDVSQFGERDADYLGPAAYKLTYRAKNGRAVYSFCMCPGGFIVNASTQEKRIAINGMSYHKRDSGFANSAIIVGVNENDFNKYGDSEDALKGIDFQIALEEKAFELGRGRIPVQRLTDFLNGEETLSLWNNLKIKGDFCQARVDKLFTTEIYESIKEAFTDFDKKIKGFINNEAYVAAVESRTSSPIRIVRDENLVSNFSGIYPAGEGAGYAGGIMSAAMDGLKIAEKLITKYYKD